MNNSEASKIEQLSVCIGSENSAWRSLLESEGVECKIFSGETGLIGSPVLILPQRSPKKIQSLAFKILSRGGAVIAESGMAAYLDSIKMESIAYPYNQTDFSLQISSEKKDVLSIDIKRVESGTLILLPFCLDKMWLDRRVEKKVINTVNGEVPYIWENLPKIVRKNVRKVVMDLLWRAHLAAGIPLIQKWYWPQDARSVFSLRADMDAGDEQSMSNYLNSVRPWVRHLSFFLCGKAYSGNLKLLQDVADLGAEVGNHTFTHYVFSDGDQNRKNIELTERLLSYVKLRPKGYVGPASFYHSSMYDVLEAKGYEYTSSFGVDHDNIPYFPSKNDSETYRMVEVPFFCLGDRFPKFGLEMNSETVGSFFDTLCEKKYRLCEPMFIYGHPDMPGRMGDSPELVKRICEKALAYDDIWTGNMADIAAWWRQRHNTTAKIEYDKDSNHVIARNYQGSPDVYWSIQTTGACKFIVSGQALQDGVSLDFLDKFKKIDMSNFSNSTIGEIVYVPPKKLRLRSKIGNWRRDLRRKRRMICELNQASLNLKRQRP